MKRITLNRRVLFIVLLLFSFYSCKTEKIKNEPGGIIMNFAADAILIESELLDVDSVSSEQIVFTLKKLIDKYAGTQVKYMFFNVNYQRACFDNDVMDTYWDLENPDEQLTKWPKAFWDIHKKGIDPYEICIERSLQKNISPWISIRMNDHHYFDDPLRINRLWLDHPEYRLKQDAMFNYAKKEVRDYYFAFISDALEKYDVDGLELDWMRTNTLFLEGEEARGMELINQFMRDVKELSLELSKEKGHPIQVAVRVPSTPKIGKSFGLDGISWAKEGLIDILIPSNWHSPTDFDIPVEQWKNEIGSESKCLIAPGADFANRFAKNKYIKQVTCDIQTMRGFSVSAFSRGADAIYIFNHFLSDYKGYDSKNNYLEEKQKAVTEIGAFSSSIGKPRVHVYTFHDPDVGPVLEEPLPLEKNKINEFDIYTGPKPSEKYIIRIGLDTAPDVEQAQLLVKINGSECKQIKDMDRDPSYVYEKTTQSRIVSTTAEAGARLMQFEAGLQNVKDGYNKITIMNTKDETQFQTWLEVKIN